MRKERLVRLGQYVMARRAALGYRHRSDLAEVLPLTDRTLASIEHGERQSAPGTYAIVETKLQWRPGSIASILAGGEPTEADAEEPNPLRNLSTDELLNLQQDLQEEVRRRYKDMRPRINPGAPNL